jgi:hypothetical protein
LLVGIAILIYGVMTWLETPQHELVGQTTYIPDYPLDDSRLHQSFIQFHRSCEWTTQKPETESVGLLRVSDALYSVDFQCTGPLVDEVTPGTAARNRLWANLAASQYGNAILRRSLSERDWFSREEIKSAAVLYRERVIDGAQRSGLPQGTATKIADTCIRSEARWCVESARLTHLHIWRHISSSAVMLSGTVLMVLGALGSILWHPVLVVWNATGGRLWSWIKVGK